MILGYIFKKNKIIYDFVEKIYIDEFFKHEDNFVLVFLKKINFYKYLEVGSGLGRFPDVVKNQFDTDITCLELSKNLAKTTRDKGFLTIDRDICDSGINDNSFDIVHCSHVIEHFSYPRIIKVLDELLRVVKTNGYVIIRSPLMNNKFFNDIDHIKPYPPEAIYNYYNAVQQQSKGQFFVKEISRWYRKKPVEFIGNSEKIKFINSLLRLSWVNFKFPFVAKTGYILILQKK